MTYRSLCAYWLMLALALFSAASASAQDVATRLSFGGIEYLHRWSKAGQHEFTPRGDENLEHWNQMITINVHDAVHDGEQLADVANRVLGNYEAHGKILRTNSIARTANRPAEHFVAAMLSGGSAMEAVFARFVLVDGVGTVAVYSRRFYGDAAKQMGEWVQANGPNIERALMSWDGLPPAKKLRPLPQAK